MLHHRLNASRDLNASDQRSLDVCSVVAAFCFTVGVVVEGPHNIVQVQVGPFGPPIWRDASCTMFAVRARVFTGADRTNWSGEEAVCQVVATVSLQIHRFERMPLA